MQTHLTAPSYPNVAMVQADDYSQQTIERAVRRVFAELEISPELFRDKNVLVKPNLLMRRRPEEATTTHPQVMRAVILRLQEMGAKQVVIADSPGGLYTPAQLRSIYSACGMQQVAEETGALLNLETGSAHVPARDPKMCTEFNLIDPVRQADDYSQQTIERAVRRVFAELEISPELFRDKNVLVKPNLLMRRRPEEATTTHPQVMRAVILRLQEMGAKQVVIADSPGGLYTPAQLRSIYSACGMQQVAEETGALLNLETGSARVPARDPKMCTEFNLIDPVRQADVIVSVGKLKTHCMTGLSGGVKNLFGCIPGLQKPQLHYRYQNRDDFCSMLVDLAQTVAPVLTVMDAVESMEGDGPSGGTIRHTGCLIACTDPFCLDLFLCDLIAMKHSQVPTVQQSIARGLCPSLAEELVLINPDSLPTRIPDFRHPQSKTVDFSGNVPGFLRPLVRQAARALSPKPVVDPQQCIGCGRCSESCPSQVIRIEQGKARIRYKHCIRCYCCHEMCPVKAIHIRGRV